MSRCPSHPFLDCAALQAQSSASEEPTSFCPPSIRSSLQPSSLITLVLPHRSLPDSYDLLVARVSHVGPPSCRGVVLPREEGLSAEQVELWGLEGKEEKVRAGEEVRFERRHVGWVVVEDRGKALSGKKGRERMEEERKRADGAKQAAKGIGLMKGSEVEVSDAQCEEDERTRQEGPTVDRDMAASGAVTGWDFEYEL